ncbi:MAG: hypothetical protein PHW72_01770 [Candidatus Pacebacteria bacterium]|nr:hypothetical protein [Candidatus Paceibacterota bacterium]
MKKILSIAILSGLLFSNISLAQLTPPDTVEESKEIIEKGIDLSIKELPQNIMRIFKEEALPVWTKMYTWFYERLGKKIVAWFNKEISPEIKKREPQFKEEFAKEKEEMREDLPQAGKSLWEKFRELIK